jgi:hypothetical protein
MIHILTSLGQVVPLQAGTFRCNLIGTIHPTHMATTHLSDLNVTPRHPFHDFTTHAWALVAQYRSCSPWAETTPNMHFGPNHHHARNTNNQQTSYQGGWFGHYQGSMQVIHAITVICPSCSGQPHKKLQQKSVGLTPTNSNIQASSTKNMVCPHHPHDSILNVGA